MANISLADKTGTFYNIGTANTEASHAVTGAVAGGMAIMEVNRVGEPTISIAGGVATKVAGVSWADSSKKYLNVYSLDGVNVLYYWTDEVSGLVQSINSILTGEPSGSSVVSNVVAISQANYDTAVANTQTVSTTFYVING